MEEKATFNLHYSLHSEIYSNLAHWQIWINKLKLKLNTLKLDLEIIFVYPLYRINGYSQENGRKQEQSCLYCFNALKWLLIILKIHIFAIYSVLHACILQNPQVDIVAPNVVELEGRESLWEVMESQGRTSSTRCIFLFLLKETPGGSLILPFFVCVRT